MGKAAKSKAAPKAQQQEHGAKRRRTGKEQEAEEVTAVEGESQSSGSGSTIGDRKEVNKMHAAMSYQKAKGNLVPLTTYLSLTSQEEKRKLLKTFHVMKNFDFIKILRRDISRKEEKVRSLEGFETRFQIAALESLDPENPFLHSLLSECPTKPHPNKDWQERKERLYYYVGQEEMNKERQKTRETEVLRQMDISKNAAEKLTQNHFLDDERPLMAITDGEVKEDPEMQRLTEAKQELVSLKNKLGCFEQEGQHLVDRGLAVPEQARDPARNQKKLGWDPGGAECPDAEVPPHQGVLGQRPGLPARGEPL